MFNKYYVVKMVFLKALIKSLFTIPLSAVKVFYIFEQHLLKLHIKYSTLGSKAAYKPDRGQGNNTE